MKLATRTLKVEFEKFFMIKTKIGQEGKILNRPIIPWIRKKPFKSKLLSNKSLNFRGRTWCLNRKLPIQAQNFNRLTLPNLLNAGINSLYGPQIKAALKPNMKWLDCYVLVTLAPVNFKVLFSTIRANTNGGVNIKYQHSNIILRL